MGNSNSIINLGDLAKPATVLVEKISDAIGGIFKPYQIRRIAQAEGEAEKIRAAAQIEVTDLQRRAMFRFIAEEAKKQDNIETITRKALPDIKADAHPEGIENDWITNFFDKCRLISDEEMQSLWARILAGEANSPGSFSRMTIGLVGSLDKSDAVLFSNLCSFAFLINGQLTPLIYDSEAKIYQDHGLHFDALHDLASIGLIGLEGGGYVEPGMLQSSVLYYFGQAVWIGFPMACDNELRTGHVLFTKGGRELAPLSGAQPREGFVEYVRERWKGFGYNVDQAAKQATAAEK